MKRGFIIGIVWTGVIVCLVSFGATVIFLERDTTQKDVVSNNESGEMEIAYITDESSIRTASLSDYEKHKKNESVVVDTIKDILKELEENSINEIEPTIENNDELGENDAVETVAETVRTYTIPVNGEILRPMAINELIYSKTLDEWCVHKGTDYKAKLGDEVFSIQDGKIKEINFNNKYGDYIIIESSDGYESLYANITVLDVLKVNDNVKKGQHIAYVAESFGFEVAEETHLHLEVKKDGKYISI